MAKTPQISTFTNLRGVDAEVQKIQSLMKGASSPINWLDYAFGMAEIGFRETTEGVETFPMCYNINSSDEQDVRPNDQWVDYCFWTYSDAGEITYDDGLDTMIYRKGKPLITYPVSCIFYMKLPTGSSYKVQKTQRRQQIVEFFDTLTGYPGIVAPTEYIDHDIKAVFEGFDLGRLPEKWFYLPYYGIRVNMDISFRNYCA